jgi:cytochrome b561
MTMRLDETTPAAPVSDSGRYSRAAMWLHWTLAVLIIVQLALGWIMNEVLPDHTPNQQFVEGVHISLGLTILILVVARIAVRLTHRPPPLPVGMPAWERILSHAVHLMFYFLMLALPLTGWALVSFGTRPISFWGLPFPHLPGIGSIFGNPPSKDMRHQLAHIHVYILIWLVVVNLFLHVAGALKHQFDGRPVLWRMTRLKPPVTAAAPVVDR